MVEASTVDSINILRELVGYDTTSYKSNLELITYIESLLSDHDIESRLVHDDSGQKANLYATIGPPDTAGIMLSGHTDVVPVTGQEWTTNPFVLVERERALFGRGSSDMKGFIACALAAIPALRSVQLKTPVHLAFSYDEEIGCIGVRRLIEMLAQQPIKPALAIIGEPTLMKPVTGHKGKLAYRVSVDGKAGHSAYTATAVNAVEYGARMITFIHSLHRQRSEKGPFDSGYQVPHTTLHTGVVNGGTALNIVPAKCEFSFEIRNIPTDDPNPLFSAIEKYADDLCREMQRVDPACNITFREITNYPGLNTDPGADVTRFVQRLIDHELPVEKVSYGTEAGLFDLSLGIPAVVCGPGSIDQAHKSGEFIDLDQVAACDRFMQRLVDFCQQNTMPQAPR